MNTIDVSIVNHPIVPSQISTLMNDPTQGAQILFSGVVRNYNLGKKVVAVSYDAFIPLAEKTLRLICEEAKEKWGSDLQVVLVHRIGRLEVGEASLVIAVGSKHRDEAYQASRYIIENTKHRVPIWKKEHYEDGETQWLEGHALCGHSPS